MWVQLVFQLFMMRLQAFHPKFGVLQFHGIVLHPDVCLCVAGKYQFDGNQRQGIDANNKKDRAKKRVGKYLFGGIIVQYQVVCMGIADQESYQKGNKVAGQIIGQPFRNLEPDGGRRCKKIEHQQVDQPTDTVCQHERDGLLAKLFKFDLV